MCTVFIGCVFLAPLGKSIMHVHVKLLTMVMRVRTLWMILCEYLVGWSVCLIMTPTKLLNRL